MDDDVHIDAGIVCLPEHLNDVSFHGSMPAWICCNPRENNIAIFRVRNLTIYNEQVMTHTRVLGNNHSKRVVYLENTYQILVCPVYYTPNRRRALLARMAFSATRAQHDQISRHCTAHAVFGNIEASLVCIAKTVATRVNLNPPDWPVFALGLFAVFSLSLSCHGALF